MVPTLTEFDEQRADDAGKIKFRLRSSMVVPLRLELLIPIRPL
jgi:hypothetical protein